MSLSELLSEKYLRVNAIASDLTPEELMLVNVSGVYIDDVIVTIKDAQTNRRYMVFHSFHNDSDEQSAIRLNGPLPKRTGPYGFWPVHYSSNIEDFSVFAESFTTILGGKLESIWFNSKPYIAGPFNARIKIDGMLTPAKVAGYVDTYEKEFDSMSIDWVVFKSIPLNKVENLNVPKDKLNVYYDFFPLSMLYKIKRHLMVL